MLFFEVPAKLHALLYVIEGSPTIHVMESDSFQRHRVDSCQALLSEELVTDPMLFVVNEGFVLGWSTRIFLQAIEQQRSVGIVYRLKPVS